MPKILHDRVKALQRKGMKSEQAWATATKQLQKEGKLKKGTQKLKGASK